MGQADLTSGIAVRAGRMVLSVFLFSDTRNVGYAQHWLRAPSEVYSQYPSSSFDGAQIQWRPRWNDVNFTAQASIGKATAGMYYSGLDIDLKVNNLRSLNVAAEAGNWTYRFVATLTRSRLDAVGIGLMQSVKHDFYGAGVQFDDGQWLLVSEFVMRRQGDGGGANSNSAYVSGGRHFGAWLPYLTFAGFEPKGVLYGSAPTGSTSAVGVRWDVRSGVALKTQLESEIPSDQAFVPG